MALLARWLGARDPRARARRGVGDGVADGVGLARRPQPARSSTTPGSSSPRSRPRWSWRSRCAAAARPRRRVRAGLARGCSLAVPAVAERALRDPRRRRSWPFALAARPAPARRGRLAALRRSLSALALAALSPRLYGFFDPRRVYGRAARAVAWRSCPTGCPGLLLDQEFGLLVYAPVFVLAVPGLVRPRRAIARGSRRSAAALVLAVVVRRGRVADVARRLQSARAVPGARRFPRSRSRVGARAAPRTAARPRRCSWGGGSGPALVGDLGSARSSTAIATGPRRSSASAPAPRNGRASCRATCSRSRGRPRAGWPSCGRSRSGRAPSRAGRRAHRRAAWPSAASGSLVAAADRLARSRAARTEGRDAVRVDRTSRRSRVPGWAPVRAAPRGVDDRRRSRWGPLYEPHRASRRGRDRRPAPAALPGATRSTSRGSASRRTLPPPCCSGARRPASAGRFRTRSSRPAAGSAASTSAGRERADHPAPRGRRALHPQGDTAGAASTFSGGGRSNP